MHLTMTCLSTSSVTIVHLQEGALLSTCRKTLELGPGVRQASSQSLPQRKVELFGQGCAQPRKIRTAPKTPWEKGNVPVMRLAYDVRACVDATEVLPADNEKMPVMQGVFSCFSCCSPAVYGGGRLSFGALPT